MNSSSERLTNRLRAHPIVVDAALAVVVYLACRVLSGGLFGVFDHSPFELLLCLPLVWRRTAPVTAAAAFTVLGLAQLARYDGLLVADVVALGMVYSLAVHAPRWASRTGLLLGLAGAVLAALRYYSWLFTDNYALSSGAEGLVLAAAAMGVTVLAAWSLGLLRRARLQQVTALEERARLLEIERDQELRLAATAERTRIAREMHDVVAHSLSIVIAQADGGRYAAPADPAAATGALEAIAATGRQALTDMRALLGVLRQDPAEEYAPQPDVAAVPALVEDVRASGLDVDLLVDGEPRPMAAGPQLAAYRVVQEALTNVLKHAGPSSRAWVRLHWQPAALEVSVLDDGRGASAALVGAPAGVLDAGQGLLGMRERARLHGGSLDVGPRSGGGFGVHAVLPYGVTR